MSHLVDDIAPPIALEKLSVEVAKQLKAQPGKPLVLYITGTEGRDKNGHDIECSACVSLDKKARDIFTNHGAEIAIHQVPTPLTMEAFQQLALQLGGTFDQKSYVSQFPNGVSYSAATPTMLRVTLDPSGKPVVSNVLDSGETGITTPQLDAWLTAQQPKVSQAVEAAKGAATLAHGDPATSPAPINAKPRSVGQLG